LRTPDPGDRRATILQPAPWPEERKEAVKAALVAAEEELFSPLSAEERRTLHRLLEKIAEHHGK
jgi:DNA-binding MarR family transcriptional regulator